jgi:hypothetical protein
MGTQLTRKTFMTSSPRWLIALTAMRPVDGFGKGREVSLLRLSQASSGDDRAGIERLIRYCARPPLALERLHALEDSGILASEDARLLYRLPEPDLWGKTALVLSPLELLERLSRLIPPPRVHRHRYHGTLAPPGARVLRNHSATPLDAGIAPNAFEQALVELRDRHPVGGSDSGAIAPTITSRVPAALLNSSKTSGWWWRRCWL